nr:BRCT domain-containing protein [Planctomycetota bacterium]
KGHGVVTLVERDRAQIRVLGLVNPLNPVVRNDFIANDLYSKDVKRNVYLVGRFVAPLSKPEIKRILEDMGNKVLDKMSPQVDLVIVGREELGEDATPIAETEDFLNATRWNIEVASINKIRDFLRL